MLKWTLRLLSSLNNEVVVKFVIRSKKLLLVDLWIFKPWGRYMLKRHRRYWSFLFIPCAFNQCFVLQANQLTWLERVIAWPYIAGGQCLWTHTLHSSLPLYSDYILTTLSILSLGFLKYRLILSFKTKFGIYQHLVEKYSPSLAYKWLQMELTVICWLSSNRFVYCVTFKKILKIPKRQSESV